jgi:diguanylate cyclase (GGDEF)-like protein
MVPMLLSFLYIFHATYICLEWAKQDGLANRRSRSLFKRLILFPLLPCVGGLIQMALPETLAIFVFTSIAILTNYIQEQNSQMVRDHLTGLYNRRQLENYLNNQLKSMKPDKSCFFLIMVDVDDFKNINDTYGHVVGDDALAHTAKILVKSFRKKEDFVARLGGDEFVVIGQVMEKEDVARLAGRLEQITKEFNEKARKPYKLSFSVGCSFAKGDGKDTLDSLINAADQQMYINKRAKKEKRKIEQMEKQGREKSDGQMAEKITMAEKIQINA